MIKIKNLLFERGENDTDDTGGVLYYYGDQVLLCKFGGFNYYMGPINTANNPNFNPDFELVDEAGSVASTAGTCVVSKNTALVFPNPS